MKYKTGDIIKIIKASESMSPEWQKRYSEYINCLGEVSDFDEGGLYIKDAEAYFWLEEIRLATRYERFMYRMNGADALKAD